MLRRLLLPTLNNALFVAVFMGSAMLGWRMLNTDGDLGRDLTLGKIILNTRTIPTRDVLSWTKAGQPRPAYEWLAQVGFAAANNVSGLDGVVVMASIAIAAAFSLVAADAARRSGAPLLSLGVSGLAAVVSSIHWLARPHVFTFVALALWLNGLERLRSGSSRWLVGMPILMLIWVNTHGGFVIGFAAWAAYVGGWLWELIRGRADDGAGGRLLLVGMTSAVASMLTPDLWGNWGAVLANRSMYILSQTAETMPPRLTMPAAWPFFVLILLTLAVAVVNARRVRADQIVLIASLGAAAMIMARNIPIFAIAAAPILAVWMAQLPQIPGAWLRWEGNIQRLEAPLHGALWPAIAALGVAAAFIIHWNRTSANVFQFDTGTFPVGAATWLSQNPQTDRMFNDVNWGGYLQYRLWPSQRVYIDSQSDFYGEAQMREYAAIFSAAPEWQDDLARENVKWLIVPPAAPIGRSALASGAWSPAYQDSTALILVHK